MSNLVPLFDQKGHVRLWLGRNNWVFDRLGNPAAYISGEGLFSVRAIHLAWWESATIVGLDGSVLLVTEGGNPWGGKPAYVVPPGAPFARLPSKRPVNGRLMPRIAIGIGWSSAEKLMAQIRLDQLVKQRAVAA